MTLRLFHFSGDTQTSAYARNSRVNIFETVRQMKRRGVLRFIRFETHGDGSPPVFMGHFTVVFIGERFERVRILQVSVAGDRRIAGVNGFPRGKRIKSIIFKPVRCYRFVSILYEYRVSNKSGRLFYVTDVWRRWDN